MNVFDLVSGASIAAGCFFFLAGTVGLLRFPDVYTRMHALTKADNLGLGFVIAGAAVSAGSLAAAAELVLVWLLVLLSSAVSSQRIAMSARETDR